MRLSSFESEFSEGDLPTVTGVPLTHAMLDAQASQADRWHQVERAQQIAVLQAVSGFYLAKRVTSELRRFTGWTNKVAASAVDEVQQRLWRLAVIDIAMVNDGNRLPRAASLPGVLDSMTNFLFASGDPAATADLAKVEALRARIDINTQMPLKYINYVRNKWAGHPSMDRDFDSWANADKYLNIPLLEEGLATLVRVHQEVADLAAASALLSAPFSVPRPEPEMIETPQGTATHVPLTVDWSSITVWAEVARESAGRRASAVLDQLTSPPGYGSPEDTDWSAGSTHAEIRTAVNGNLDG